MLALEARYPRRKMAKALTVNRQLTSSMNPAERREYRRLHAARLRESNRDYKRRNKPIVKMQTAARRAAQYQAQPVWANKERIRIIYLAATVMSRELGVSLHVDHIEPLRSNQVCGLHCETNLRIVTALENMKKGNRTVTPLSEVAGAVS